MPYDRKLKAGHNNWELRLYTSLERFFVEIQANFIPFATNMSLLKAYAIYYI